MNERELSEETIRITHPNLLIVEGTHEQQFFNALIRQMGLVGIQVLPLGGKDKLKSTLPLLKVSPNFDKVRTMTIVRDADDDPASSFRSVCSRLRTEGLPVPQNPASAEGSKPRVCVMILPDKDASGSLEDVCLQSVADCPEIDCVDRYFECLGKVGRSLPRQLSKARVQVFLASKEHTVPLGLAAQKNYWPWDSKAFDEIKRMLQGCVT